MGFDKLIELTAAKFKKVYKDADHDFKPASKELPPTGLIVDNPQLEFILDRRFLAYGRFYLLYGQKSSGKTSMLYDLMKTFQAKGGDVVWIETERAIDIDYAKKQGVNLDKLIIKHPQSLEQGLELIKMFIRNMPAAYENEDTPVLIAYDSLVGVGTEYDLDPANTLSEGNQPGIHARIIAKFYSEIVDLLANEKAIVLMLNQLKNKIGAFGFSEDSQDALKGGEAQYFYSSYHWKFKKIGEVTAPDSNGAERKIMSKHKIECKRNKLGREGKGQHCEVDLYIDGGMDWWSPLVRRLGDAYHSLVTKVTGGYCWKVPDIKYNDPETGEIKIIETGKDEKGKDIKYGESELALIIKNSEPAKELIRTAFGIPPLPTAEEEAIVEADNKKKRGRKKAEPQAEEVKQKFNPVK